MFGIGDVFDKLNSAIDDLTGQDWLGDLVATGGAIATGQWDEVAQHGLDLLEDGFDLVGWEEGAQWAKYASETTDLVSDLYHGRYNEALATADRLYGEITADGSAASHKSNAAGSTDPEEAGLYWKEQVLTGGTQDYMRALINGDASAVAALKDPTFMTILQQKMNEENQRMSLISNLIDVQHRTLMASVNNMRV